MNQQGQHIIPVPKCYQVCREYNRDFDKMKRWYDGYSFRNIESVYNPNSVIEAIHNDDYDSYWTQTSAAESLMGYINLDFDGLGRMPVM